MQASNGEPACALQVYCHHFFGDGRFVLGEGAELRGSENRRPLPEPYFYIVNGSYFADPSTRCPSAGRLCPCYSTSQRYILGRML
jgi:hypothetical protein